MLNNTKTFLLLAALTALFLWVGQALGGRSGVMVALLLAMVINLAAYWFSDKIVLRMYGAREIGPADQPDLYHIVRELSVRAGLPMPRLYVIPEAAPNAFATGRSPDHASVAVTQGLLAILNVDELRGVIAHELAHIRNRDTLVMTIVATIAGALSHVVNMAMWGALLGGRHSEDDEGGHPVLGLLAMLMAPFAAAIIQMAISRGREFLADESGAGISGAPLSLASALRKLESGRHTATLQRAEPATAHLFIVNPFSGAARMKLFSTHPPIEERIVRLEALARRVPVFA